MSFQAVALKIGSILVGALLTYGAIDQVRKGETFGATGKGRISRETEPVYFLYMFCVRIVLGLVLLGGGIYM